MYAYFRKNKDDSSLVDLEVELHCEDEAILAEIFNSHQSNVTETTPAKTDEKGKTHYAKLRFVSSRAPLFSVAEIREWMEHFQFDEADIDRLCRRLEQET